MNGQSQASYNHCRRLARRAASSFYYSLLLLPRAKRRSMYALYAFLRHTDDLSDSGEPVDVRRESLAGWRASLARALEGQFDDPLLPALADTVRRYAIPTNYLYDVLDGMEMDLEPCRYETFAELQQYCHRVASVVGLSCIHIWGFHGQEAIEPAKKCGLAFQLTNILRDLKEDAGRGRVYLPVEDMQKFDYTADDLRRGLRDHRLAELIRFETRRAERLFQEALPLEQYIEADSRRVFRAMVATYRGLLREIEHRDGDVFGRPIHLSLWKKLGIVAGWFVSGPLPVSAPAVVKAKSP